MRQLSRATAAVASALSLSLLAACGGGDRQETDAGEVSRDTSVIAPVTNDSARADALSDPLAAVRGRRDVAREQGITAKHGIDQAAAAGAAAAANDSARNIPGVPELRARSAPQSTPQPAPGTKRP